jgi:hypothetical protein
MATSYTTFLGLALPVTGELSGTWGDTVNNYISNYLDAAIAGAQTVTTDTTLTKTTGSSLGATSSQYAIIIASPASANITITAPAASKIYTIINTSATYTVKIVGAGPTTGVTLGVSEKAQVAWNGSDFVRIGASGGAGVFSSITNTGLTSGRVVYSTTGGLETDSANLLFNGTTLTANTLNLTNALGTTYGGTGLTSFTSGGVVYASSSSALTTGSALTFDGNANLSTGGSNPATYNTLNINNTSSTGYSRVLFNIGSAGANGIGGIKYAPGIFFAIGTDSDSSSTPMTFNLNGSEQMRLTSTGLGIGTSSPTYNLDIYASLPQMRLNATTGTNAAFYRVQNTGGSAFVGLENSTGSALSTGAAYSLNLYHGGAYPILFSTNAAERMRLDSSGNLGVGTSSTTNIQGDASKLITSSGSASNTLSVVAGGYINPQYAQIFLSGGYGDNGYVSGFYLRSQATVPFGAASDAAFQIYSTVRAASPTLLATLSSGGNLGLGVTPDASDWNASMRVFHAYQNTTNGAGVKLESSSSKMIMSAGNALNYLGSIGATPIVFVTNSTERMRLDSSGNLGLGVTPSASNLPTIESQYGLVVGQSQTNIVANGYYSSGYLYKTTAAASRYQQITGAHIWYNAPSGTAGNAITFTQAMTLDASGNLGVGVTSINQTGAGAARVVSIGGTNQAFVEYIGATGSGIVTGSLHRNASALVGGIYVENNTGNQGIIEFNTNDGTTYAERARIDASGNLLVSTNSFALSNSNSIMLSGSTGGALYVQHASGTASGTIYSVFVYNGGLIGSITQNGTTGVLYNITSDYRLKTVIGPVASAGQRIDALKPVEYEWKSDGSAARGFLAHEFQEVYPNSVTGAKDSVDADGNPVYQNMQASTSEVIADLVAEIQSLRIRIAQLEAK